MLDRFKNHIIKRFPYLLTSKVAIASSGGIDSMVLTHLCYQLGMDICVLHCNFQLRGDASLGDEDFLQQKMETFDIPFYSIRFMTNAYAEAHKISTQIAARELRYDWFKQQKDILNFEYLLTGHHADDNLETFLINLSRGTGIEGLTGIPEINDYIVRPLLPFSRDEIFQYALHNEIKWREDSSNAETKYLRNKIRHEVIPKIKEINPSVLQSFENTVNHLKGSSEILNSHIDSLRSDIFIKGGKDIKVSIAALQNLTPKESYFYHLFKDFGFNDPTDLINIIDSQSGKQLFSSTHRLVRDRDEIIISTAEKEEEIVDFFIEESQSLITTPIKISIDLVEHIEAGDSHSIYVDKETLKFPLKLRKWENGDYFYPFGMQGKKKLSKFFKDEKISLLDKEKQWLLCDTHNTIIWIVGKRADNQFKVTEKTKQIIKIQYVDA
ncbi:tRNA lysidine(34) synthetase TilS [Joostella sp.]|uniref:tRNA lysidine(34) synthetase TilS n=1 Tax=Joostella sp. TaxID=2231138 RepID=UPI003A942F11